jgi:hypothetical protein
MMRTIVLNVLLVGALATTGCEQKPEAGELPQVEQPRPLTTQTFAHPTPIDVGDEPVRQRNRLTIDQLNASIRQVSGGVGWVIGGVDQLEALAPSLGVPDYALTTQEDLEPSALFQKFLGDAARHVCTELEQNARAGEGGSVLLGDLSAADTLEVNSSGVVANLARLVLRFHGQSFAVDAAEIERWRWLFESSYALSGDALTSWNVICVGLITHPDFYTY